MWWFIFKKEGSLCVGCSPVHQIPSGGGSSAEWIDSGESFSGVSFEVGDGCGEKGVVVTLG